MFFGSGSFRNTEICCFRMERGIKLLCGGKKTYPLFCLLPTSPEGAQRNDWSSNLQSAKPQLSGFQFCQWAVAHIMPAVLICVKSIIQACIADTKKKKQKKNMLGRWRGALTRQNYLPFSVDLPFLKLTLTNKCHIL